MKFFTTGVLTVFILMLGIACSSTQSTTVPSTESASSSKFPGWYNSSEFSSDSTGFNSYATAIAADSSSAVQRAENRARMILEQRIGAITEDIRKELEANGNSDADNTDFIIILRSASSKIGNAASASRHSVEQNKEYYRAFVSAEISRGNAAKVLEEGFTGHPRYWSSFFSAPAFGENFR